MTTLIISILAFSLTNPTVQETHEFKQHFSSYSECLRVKESQEALLTKLSEESILGYSIKCK